MSIFLSFLPRLPRGQAELPDLSMRVLEELLQESRFSGLPWFRENDGGELTASAFQNRLKRSGNEISTRICTQPGERFISIRSFIDLPG
jgi:hypothetical protein